LGATKSPDITSLQARLLVSKSAHPHGRARTAGAPSLLALTMITMPPYHGRGKGLMRSLWQAVTERGRPKVVHTFILHDVEVSCLHE
jgi:hypothetical protein